MSAEEPPATTTTGASGPLNGIRVLDLSAVVMGPYGTQLLGDLGADVIKVETRGGDSSRVMGGGPHAELSGIALNLHRNKRSIALNLKQPRGREVFLRLLDTCQVLVTNLRPGPMRRLGLSFEEVSETRPRLIYCQAHGFRSDSPESERPAYDDIIQALTGLPQLNSHVLGVTQFMPSLIADKIAGMTIAYGVLAALVHAERTGEGQRVEVPMFDAVLAFNLVEHLSRAVTPGEPAGYSRILTHHRGPHRTLDGHIAMMPYTDNHWRSLFVAVGMENMLDRPWFADHATRLLSADRVYGDLAHIVAQRTTADWLSLCEEHGIPASPVPTLDDVVSDSALHRGVLRDADHPVTGHYREIVPPLVLSASPASVRRAAPLFAEHTEAVLSELGYDRADIEELLAEGAVELRVADDGEP